MVTSLRRSPKRATQKTPAPKAPRATQVLFPGYIFFAPQHVEQSIAPVRSTLGITRVVHSGLELARISDRLLEDILAFVDQTERSPGGLVGSPESHCGGRNCFGARRTVFGSL